MKRGKYEIFNSVHIYLSNKEGETYEQFGNIHVRISFKWPMKAALKYDYLLKNYQFPIHCLISSSFFLILLK